MKVVRRFLDRYNCQIVYSVVCYMYFIFYSGYKELLLYYFRIKEKKDEFDRFCI